MPTVVGQSTADTFAAFQNEHAHPYRSVPHR
jgi:hypothetical protein